MKLCGRPVSDELVAELSGELVIPKARMVAWSCPEGGITQKTWMLPMDRVLCLTIFSLVVFDFANGNLGEQCDERLSADCEMTVFRSRAITLACLAKSVPLLGHYTRLYITVRHAIYIRPQS